MGKEQLKGKRERENGGESKIEENQRRNMSLKDLRETDSGNKS